MLVSTEVLSAARIVAGETGVDPAALLAVALAETGAKASAPVEGGRAPLIRFEGHYFDRLLGEEERSRARAAGLSHPQAGKVRNPAFQTARWDLLRQAAAIDPEAAFAAASWGLGQVMGAHWRMLGFESARAMASAEGQLRLAARFLQLGRLDRLLAEGDFTGFASTYNRPAYRRNRYHKKIAAAYAQARQVLGDSPDLAVALRPGLRGLAVKLMQIRLCALGRHLAADGIFGSRTGAALRVFQKEAGLASTGLLDRPDAEALSAAASGRRRRTQDGAEGRIKQQEPILEASARKPGGAGSGDERASGAGGWPKPFRLLFRVARWFTPLRSTRRSMPFFSTSTEPSSILSTIRRPSSSGPPRWSG